ncbi:MAG: HepT-like ribonuclease domain-containing protein [Planctomycetota bacterium]
MWRCIFAPRRAGGPPADKRRCVRCLAAQSVLSAELAEALALAVRFPNLLVHEYADIDDDRVVAFLDRVGDLVV